MAGSEADFEQFLAIAEDMRNEIVEAQKEISKAVSGLVGKEHTTALLTCTKDLEQAMATMERLEQRPQQDIAGRLDDLLAHLTTPAPRFPWYWIASACTLLLLIGTCVGWGTKPRLFLSPIAQVIQQAECPGMPTAPRKGGK